MNFNHFWMFFKFQAFFCSLPERKHSGMEKGSRTPHNKQWSTAKELESLVGQMPHLSVIVPLVHFLSRLRGLQAKSKNRRKIKICARYLGHLRLMIFCLEKAYQGNDMSMVSYFSPPFCYHGNSWPHGL